MKRENIAVPEELQQFFKAHPRLALAFSGGCDSAYLLYAAVACGADVRAYYVRSQFQPDFELEDARMLVDKLGQKLHVLELDILADEQVRLNPANRCYYCKKRIFQAILEAAYADGYCLIADGTNASDDDSDRPGMRALQEMQVVSPLRSCKIGKKQLRMLSEVAGLFTWNKPAYACLATRIPAGMPIDAETLKRVERAEVQLAGMGFEGMRVRVTPAGARLEVTQKQLPLVLEKREALIAALERDFREITLDLRPRREIEV